MANPPHLFRADGRLDKLMPHIRPWSVDVVDKVGSDPPLVLCRGLLAEDLAPQPARCRPKKRCRGDRPGYGVRCRRDRRARRIAGKLQAVARNGRLHRRMRRVHPPHRAFQRHRPGRQRDPQQVPSSRGRRMNSQDVPTTEESQPQRRQEGLPVSERLALSVEKPARCWAFPEILAYDLVARRELPSVRLGRRLVVPVGRSRMR